MSAGRGTSPHLSRIVNKFSLPLSLRLQATLSAGIQRGEFRSVDVIEFIPSMIAMIIFYFVTAPVRLLMRGTDPFSPEALQARRTAVLDHIAAMLFADREAGLRLAAQIAETSGPPPVSALATAAPHRHVAARRRK